MLGLISVVQLVNHFLPFDKENEFDFQSSEIRDFQKQIDSLKLVELERRRPKIYPFNPNYITDYKGYQLGMSTQEIDRLLDYRSKNKFVNSAKEFQKITEVSDSLLGIISPYFKFPSWVNAKKRNRINSLSTFDNEGKKNKAELSTTDINKATLNDFLFIHQVDDVLAERIVKYREKLQGFSFADQVFEVWGLTREIGDKILNTFSIKTQPKIQKIDINTASFKSVLSIPYIDYELCKKIFEFRDEVAELQSISELKNIEDFPIEKYDRIVLYLYAK